MEQSLLSASRLVPGETSGGEEVRKVYVTIGSLAAALGGRGGKGGAPWGLGRVGLAVEGELMLGPEGNEGKEGFTCGEPVKV